MEVREKVLKVLKIRTKNKVILKDVFLLLLFAHSVQFISPLLSESCLMEDFIFNLQMKKSFSIYFINK